MPKNQFNDPITDQEIAFAHLILSGTMTDRRAAEAVGLNPDSAAHIKAKPRVQAYMLEHPVAMHQQRVQQEAEELGTPNVIRERVLARLWEIADLSHEVTRNSASAQVKALSMIIAIEALIPNRRAGSAEKKPTSPPPILYKAPWLRELQAKAAGLQPNPDLVREEEEPGIPPSDAAADAAPIPGSTPDPDKVSGEPIAARTVSPARTESWVPDAYGSAFAPDLRVPFSIKKGRFGWRQ